jgi:hypothetical protein
MGGTPEEKLREMAIDCMTKNSGSEESAINALVVSIRNNDAVSGRILATAAKSTILHVKREALRAQKPFGGDDRRADYLRGYMSSAQQCIRQHDELCPTKAFETEVKKTTGAIAEVIQSAATARLSTFLVEGKPLGDCTAREALAWADRQETNIEFVRALCHGVPLDDRLNQWYSGAEVDVEAIWKRCNSRNAREQRIAMRDEAYKWWNKAQKEAERLGDDGLRLFHRMSSAFLDDRERTAHPEALRSLS